MNCVNCERPIPLPNGYRNRDGSMCCDDCHERQVARETRESVNPRPTQLGVPVGKRSKNTKGTEE